MLEKIAIIHNELQQGEFYLLRNYFSMCGVSVYDYSVTKETTFDLEDTFDTVFIIATKSNNRNLELSKMHLEMAQSKYPDSILLDGEELNWKLDKKEENEIRNTFIEKCVDKIYALGMNAKPKVVDDATLDGMQGREIFRTVYEKGVMPPPTTEAVVDQIRHGDYTQMSNSGGSLYGRAIYFATNFNDSASYGSGERNAMIMRGKLDVNAKFPTETTLRQQMRAKNFTASKKKSVDSDDGIALYAISQGLPGWHDGSYTMIVNRSVITMSSKNKRISKSSARQAYSSHDANSWSEAGDVN